MQILRRNKIKKLKQQIVFLLFLIFQVSYSQEIKISKNSLSKVFEQTIIQTKKGIIQTDSIPWFTDNSNDVYFKNDTITFVNAKTFKRDFCKIINWTFYKKDSFVIGNADYCNEPPSKRAIKSTDWINLKNYNYENDLILELYNQNKLIEKFKVLSIQKNQSIYNADQTDYVLKLLRIKLK